MFGGSYELVYLRFFPFESNLVILGMLGSPFAALGLAGMTGQYGLPGLGLPGLGFPYAAAGVGALQQAGVRMGGMGGPAGSGCVLLIREAVNIKIVR